MNAQQLKNSILQMAVQGKLVPQDPNDEPASVLLERIRKEKEKLIKEGKIKKEKNPSYIFRGEDNLPYEKVGKNEPVCIADEVPFEIPETWEWCRLGDVFNLVMGQSPDGESVSDSGSGMEFHQGKICFGKRYLLPSMQVTTTPTKIAPANSVLLCVRAPVGKVNITDREICIGRGLCAVVPRGGITVEFTFFLLETYETIFTKQATGTTFIAVTGEVVKKQLIPVPPLEEQKRLVNKIESLLPLVEEYDIQERSLGILNDSFPELLKKSILQQAVMGELVPQDPNDEPAAALLERIRTEKNSLIKAGKLKKDKHESIIYRRDNSYYEKLDGIERCIDDELPFDIPETWSWVRLNQFAFLTSGSQYTESDCGCLYVKVSDMNLPENEDEIITSNHHTTDCIQGDIFENSIIFPKRGGAIATNKRRKILNQRVCIDSNTMAITAYVKECFDYLYLWFLTVDLGKLQTGTSVPQINNKDLEPKLIPVPPIEEQKRIVAKIKEFSPFVIKCRNKVRL